MKISETWYLLYGGQSVDGSVPGVYVGRTTDAVEAANHFKEVNMSPYSTGYVEIITDLGRARM